MKKWLKGILFFSCAAILFSSCTASLQPYERVFVDDEEMKMGLSACQKFELYVHTIREGGIAPLGQKGSGGCGCN